MNKKLVAKLSEGFFAFDVAIQEEVQENSIFRQRLIQCDYCDRSRLRDQMDHPLFQLLGFPDEFERALNPSAQKYASDTKAMYSTAVDVKEAPKSYIFVADMPGLKSSDIKVPIP